MQCNNQYKRIVKGMTHLPPKCGKCYACKREKAKEWLFRIHWEDKLHIHSQFITLTYDSNHVPITISELTERPIMELRYKDVQDFLKRLREHINYHNYETTIRYFVVGEYGKKFKRPHYHIILWGSPVNENKLNQLWGNGLVHVGEITGKSINYVSGYTMKLQPKYVQRHGITPEMTKMSKGRTAGCGIGINYLEFNAINHINNEDDTIHFGKAIQKLPRYFKDRLWNTAGTKMRKMLKAINNDDELTINNHSYELAELFEQTQAEDNIKNRINKKNRKEAQETYKKRIEILSDKQYKNLEIEELEELEEELLKRNNQRNRNKFSLEKHKINTLD